VGANYRAHLERLGVTESPPHPTAFMKPNSAIVGPDSEVRYPSTTEQLDYEVELVIALAGASSAPLLGYTIGNDVSARDAKGLAGLDLFGMKSLDATSPIGPWIVTQLKSVPPSPRWRLRFGSTVKSGSVTPPERWCGESRRSSNTSTSASNCDAEMWCSPGPRLASAWRTADS
jgi:2-keto-4-pentenoate hydratase/2-oxohepta-3-ene-1,7-dioic acid hydratase in catechol pathway